MTKPPKPPRGTDINMDDRGVVWVSGQKWGNDAKDVTVYTLDQTGKRTTVTRVALMGPLALLMKKKTGDVTVVLAATSGATATVKVKAKHAAEVMAWAVAFNAWVSVNS